MRERDLEIESKLREASLLSSKVDAERQYLEIDGERKKTR